MAAASIVFYISLVGAHSEWVPCSIPIASQDTCIHCPPEEPLHGIKIDEIGCTAYTVGPIDLGVHA